VFLYNMYNKIRFFDVSLRDGLQSIPKICSMKEKKHMLHNIIKKFNPPDIEIGSIVSPKLLPQMADSIELHNYAKSKFPKHNFYMLVPNEKYFEIAKKSGIKNFSFITSVSNSFQIKNTNKTINETNIELSKILAKLDDTHKSKLYVSCITQCPIDNQQNIDKIVYTLNNNLHFPVDNVCLSDTCGTLNFSNFKNIYDNLDVLRREKLSLHLHNPHNPDIPQIVSYALRHNIRTIDVCFTDMGGCSVTINDDQLKSNLTYAYFKELYEKS
jgi:hydroxymethylglutaryl-CoA lyase